MMYQNFVNFSELMGLKVDKIISQLSLNLKLPQLYQVELTNMYQLEYNIKTKDTNPMGLVQISKLIRGGMNRNAHITAAFGDKDEV